MDAIRKKMQSLKSETDSLYATIQKHEDSVKESNAKNDQHECDIRDLGKKIQTYEVEFDETNDKLTKVLATYEEKEKEFKQFFSVRGRPLHIEKAEQKRRVEEELFAGP